MYNVLYFTKVQNKCFDKLKMSYKFVYKHILKYNNRNKSVLQKLTLSNIVSVVNAKIV